ncbi:MAG: extracellular solute-binding protein [Sphingobacteriaceae bacterium]
MVELKGITWDHPRGYAPLQASTKRYMQQTGVSVTWDRRSLKDFGDISVEMLADNYDLLIIDHPHMGVVDSSACLLNLNDHLSSVEIDLYKKESVGPSFSSYYYNNKQWALPVDAACQAAAYRPDLVDEVLLPSSWDNLVSFSAVLRLKKQFIGTALCPTDCNSIFLTLSAQTGNPVTGYNKELIPLERGIQILEMMMTLKQLSHPESLNWNPINLYDQMVSSDEVVYSPLAYAYINYSSIGSLEKQLKYTSIPGKTHAILGGAGMAVSAKSKHIKQAVDYLKWMCHPDYQKSYYLKQGGQPGQLSAWTDSENNISSGNFLSALLPTINTAFVRPRLPMWPEYQEWLGDIIHDYLKNNMDATVVIEEINKEFKRVFKIA